MDRQYTGWGYVDWISSENDRQNGAMNIGIVSISPKTHMSPHIHFTEQALYTLGGEGYSVIDGKKIDMSTANEIFHWSAGVMHEMYNTGETEFKHLMISSPDSNLNINPFDSDKENVRLSQNEIFEYFNMAVHEVKSQFLDSLQYTYLFFDSIGNLSDRSRNFPSFCYARCEQELLKNSAPCMCSNVKLPIYEEGSFICPHRLMVIYYPINFNGQFLGYVQGGFLHTMPPEDEASEIYITPRSTIYGAQVLLQKIARSMVNFCELHHFKKDLLRRDTEIADKSRSQELLTANLKDAEDSMTDLKINNHFLFNALNQMASMALEGGLLPLYKSIVELSKLFHYTLRNHNNIVTLDKEFEYLQAYLLLQKLRYEDNLVIENSIKTDLSTWEVPFNFLMSVAENAFKHGFVDETLKRIYIYIGEYSGKLQISIGNNGVILEQDECEKIMSKMKSDLSHGLSMIYRKLKSVYGNEFSVEVSSDAINGTEFHFTLPAKKIKEACI